MGLKSNYTILDTDDVERLLKALITADGIDPKRWSPKHLSNLIDGWKNKGWTPDKVPPSADGFAPDAKGSTPPTRTGCDC